MPHRNPLTRKLLRTARQRIGEKRLARYRARATAIARRLARYRRRLQRAPTLELSRCVSYRDGCVLFGHYDANGPGPVTLRLPGSNEPAFDASLHSWPTPHRSLGASPHARAFALRIESPMATRLRITDQADRSRTVTLPRPIQAARQIGVRALLEPLERVQNRRALHERVLAPAIEALMQEATASPAGEVDAFNAALASTRPRTTLLIPVYGRFDFIEHQIARFANDPDVCEQDILYVIDDPSLRAAVRQRCETLAKIYPVPFRVLYLERNLGYAGANNAGARHALGDYLLLLNSDVMPIESGWLARLFDQAGEAIDSAVIGVRLLFEDGSVQHDGMRFSRSGFHEGIWLNMHPGKGLPAALLPTPAGLVAREAVTGACLLVSRAHYESLGGLDERYVLGDFEDSDFCLSARREGLDVLLCPSVQLYHLERQSQSMGDAPRWKEELTWFNGWQHAEKWHRTLQHMDRTRAA